MVILNGLDLSYLFGYWRINIHENVLVLVIDKKPLVVLRDSIFLLLHALLQVLFVKGVINVAQEERGKEAFHQLLILVVVAYLPGEMSHYLTRSL